MRKTEKNERGKRVIQIIFGLLAAGCLCLPTHVLASVPPAEAARQAEVSVQQMETGKPEEAAGKQAEGDIGSTGAETIFYTALGDSIANGYYGAQESEVVGYPALIAEDLAEISGHHVELTSFAKNGLTSKKLNKKILPEPLAVEAVEKADLITLTIGANDLMNEFKKVSREILNNETRFYTADEAVSALQEGIVDNPLLLIDVVSAINSWDYDSFEERWAALMEYMDLHRKEDSQFVVTTIYNPMAGRELPGTLNAVIESVISKMNQIMQDHAEEYDYRVVDLLGSGIEAYVQSDGLHPNQTGQNLIRELVEYQLDLDDFRSESTDFEAQRALEEAAAQKAEAAEQRRQAEIRKIRMLTAGCTAGVFFAVIGIVIVWKKKTAKKGEQ